MSIFLQSHSQGCCYLPRLHSSRPLNVDLNTYLKHTIIDVASCKPPFLSLTLSSRRGGRRTCLCHLDRMTGQHFYWPEEKSLKHGSLCISLLNSAFLWVFTWLIPLSSGHSGSSNDITWLVRGFSQRLHCGPGDRSEELSLCCPLWGLSSFPTCILMKLIWWIFTSNFYPRAERVSDREGRGERFFYPLVHSSNASNSWRPDQLLEQELSLGESRDPSPGVITPGHPGCT